MTTAYVLNCPGYTSKLHEIGLVQSGGYLVAVKQEDYNIYRVTDVSNNITKASWINEKDISNFFGKSLTEIFDLNMTKYLNELLERYKSTHPSTSSERMTPPSIQLLPVLSKSNHIQCGYRLLCCSVMECKNRKDSYILEFEEVDNDSLVTNKLESVLFNTILQSGDTVARIQSATSIQAVVEVFVDSVMKTESRYDRGMSYRFCDDDSGEVIYENLRDPNKLQSSYMNLRFPAADIPPQVRHLLVKNRFRMITDTKNEDSKIISTVDSPMDLTLSVFRAPHECHKQYLRNMGVRSTMTLAIVVENKLWGLHVFHSYDQTVQPAVEQRICLEMIASIASMRVQSFISESNSSRKLKINQLMLALPNSKTVKDFLQTHHVALLNGIEANTLVLYFDDGRRLVYGDESILPTDEGYEKLLNISKMSTILSINNFTEGLCGLGAGIIFYKHQNATLAFIRKNRVCDVKWGGKDEHFVDSNDRLHPRASFDMYLEKARHESIKWSQNDCDLLSHVIDQLVQCLHTEMLTSFRLSLDQSNSECLQVIQSSKENYEFFAHMSHELRTPFHGVISSLQILQAGRKSLQEEEIEEIVDSALDCGKTMLRTLDDILTIAKHKNNVEVAQNTFFIAKVVDATKNLMSPMAECRSLNFSCQIENVKVGTQQLSELEFKDLALIGDETRIGQVANNLTNNAIKFTPTGGSVSVKASVLSSASDVLKLWEKESSAFGSKYVYDGKLSTVSAPATVFLTLSVKDSGCGIPGSDLCTVFDAYKQVSSGVSKSYQGTGLGLHIVQLHIDAMSGMISVASQPNEGTIFFFCIPLLVAVDESPLQLREILKSKSRKNSVRSLSSIEINAINQDSIFLVVDDSQINLRLAKRKIQLAIGNEVAIQTAEDGVEAIEAFNTLVNTGKHHLLKGIFMDYHMPRCSGLEAIVAIRKIEKQHPNLVPCHIIAFTADLSEESQKVLVSAGSNEVMSKPTPAGLMEEACIKLAMK